MTRLDDWTILCAAAALGEQLDRGLDEKDWNVVEAAATNLRDIARAYTVPSESDE